MQNHTSCPHCQGSGTVLVYKAKVPSWQPCQCLTLPSRPASYASNVASDSRKANQEIPELCLFL